MFAYAESVLIIVLEVLCCMIFYGAFGKKKKNGKKWIEHALLLLLVLDFFCSALLFEQIILLKTFIIVFGIAIVMYCIIDINFMKSLCIALLYEGFIFAVDYLTLLMCVTVFNGVAQIEDSYYIQGGLLVLLDKIILFSLVMMIRKVMGNYEIGIMKDSEWLKFICFPIYTICAIVGMIFVLGTSHYQNKNIIFFIIAFGLVGMNLFVFYLISGIMKIDNKIYEDKIFRFQIKNQTELYYSISENLERQRKKTHEYKNQLVCINSLLKRNKVKELNNYINEIGGRLETESDRISTNHVIVDAILNTKYSEMIEKDIVFEFHINDLSNLMISDEDIVVILSNLLNNAIDACEKCPEKRSIELEFVIGKNVTVISVKNTYENELVKNDRGFLTMKNEEAGHGIGICNIANVIEKYGGSYVITPDDGEFYFSIVIPQKRKEE